MSSSIKSCRCSREASAYDLAQDDRVVVFDVPGGEDEGHGAMARSPTEFREPWTLLPKFLEIAPAELLETIGPMPEPRSECSAGREVPLPRIKPRAIV
jgi:hypothetical protein